MSIPAFGLGTYRLKGQAAIDSVRTGLELGYRHVDTAQIYGNEAEVGQAVADSGVARDEVFLTTKIWTENLTRERLIPSLRESLAKLRTDRVDLTLIHWPSPGGAAPLAESLQALAEAQEAGLTGAIGVSNFNIALLREAFDAVGAQRIATHQVELHPYLQNRELAGFARAHGLHLTSYMTLAYGKVLADPLLAEIAAAHDASVAQVALAWAMQQGHAVIPSSTRRDNLAANLRAQTLRLSEDELARIATLDRGERLVDPEGLAPKWD